MPSCEVLVWPSRGRRIGRSWLMSAEEENKRLALTVIEALNARDLDPWSQKLSDDYAAEYPGVSTLNKTHSIGYNERFVIAFPDLHFDTVTGRTIPPTRRKATVSGVLLTEVRDGKIAREHWYWDQLSLLDQLGILEHPGLFLSHEGF